MQLYRFAGMALVLAAVFGFGCSPATESPLPRPDIGTLGKALSERDELERMYLLTSYLRAFRPEDLPAALAQIRQHRVGITADEMRLFMLAWTRFDGPGAFAAARDWPTDWTATLTEQAMHAWGFNDGQAALAELERIEDEELRERLRGALVAGWVASDDRQGVTEYAMTVAKPRRQNRLVLRITGQAMRDGPEAVIAWADSVPIEAPGDFKQTVFIHATGSVARVDPERLKPWYEREMNQAYSATALHNIAVKWSRHNDPKLLLAWIETLDFDEAREAERADAIKAAFREWAADAPGEAEAWLEAASAGPARDGAIHEFARATIDTSPEVALKWVALIADERERQKYTFRYGRQWINQDFEAAQIWLANADIPDDWRQKIPKDVPIRKNRDAVRAAQPNE